MMKLQYEDWMFDFIVIEQVSKQNKTCLVWVPSCQRYQDGKNLLDIPSQSRHFSHFVLTQFMFDEVDRTFLLHCEKGIFLRHNDVELSLTMAPFQGKTIDLMTFELEYFIKIFVQLPFPVKIFPLDVHLLDFVLQTLPLKIIKILHLKLPFLLLPVHGHRSNRKQISMSEFLHSQLNIIHSELFSAIFPHILNRNFNKHFGLVFNMRHHEAEIAL